VRKVLLKTCYCKKSVFAVGHAKCLKSMNSSCVVKLCRRLINHNTDSLMSPTYAGLQRKLTLLPTLSTLRHHQPLHSPDHQSLAPPRTVSSCLSLWPHQSGRNLWLFGRATDISPPDRSPLGQKQRQWCIQTLKCRLVVESDISIDCYCLLLNI